MYALESIILRKMTAFIIAGAIGPWQIVIIVLVVLLFFGGRKIPELMKGLGQGMREFKKAVKDESSPNDSQKKAEEQ